MQVSEFSLASPTLLVVVGGGLGQETVTFEVHRRQAMPADVGGFIRAVHAVLVEHALGLLVRVERPDRPEPTANANSREVPSVSRGD